MKKNYILNTMQKAVGLLAEAAKVIFQKFKSAASSSHKLKFITQRNPSKQRLCSTRENGQHDFGIIAL